MVYSIGKSNFSDTEITFIPALIIIVLFFMEIIWAYKSLFKNEIFCVAFIQGPASYNSYVFIAITLLYINSDVMPVISLITVFLVMTTNIASVFVLDI